MVSEVSNAAGPSGLAPEELAAFVDTARRFARREVAALVGTEGRDGDLAGVPALLGRAAEAGLLASPDPEAPGHAFGVWGQACLGNGPGASLAVLRAVAAECAGVGACLQAAGLGALALGEGGVAAAPGEAGVAATPREGGVAAAPGGAAPSGADLAGAGPVAVGLGDRTWALDADALARPPAEAARVTGQGERSVLTGGVSFVCAAPGTVGYVVFAAGERGWERVYVPASAPGLRVTPVGLRTGLAALEVSHLAFEGVAVPAAHRLGPGDPAALLVRTLLGLAALAVGNAEGALTAATAYAAERIQGGVPIAEHPAVRLLLGEARARVAVLGAALEAAGAGPRPLPDLAAALALELRATVEARHATSDALQVLGGYGYMEEYRLEKRLRDALTLEAMVLRPDAARSWLGRSAGAEREVPGPRVAPRGGELPGSGPRPGHPDHPLHPISARATLRPLGRLLYAAEPQAIWERDTASLPRVFASARRRYRAFAAAHLAPRGLAADRDPAAADVKALFAQAARDGLQTELMPPPFGTLRLSSLWRVVLLPSALKAEELCAADGGLGLALLAHELGVAPLFVSGDLGSYVRWLGRIYRECRAGEPAIAAFAITEPGAGSDVEDTEGGARARLGCTYRREGGAFVLSGRKVFISNGKVARWVTLFAAEKGRGLETWTCFLLDKAMAGFSVGRSERKMGQRAADASELLLEEVRVPGARVIGGVGQGWAVSRNVLNFSRPVVGAIALGIARGAFEHAAAFTAATRLGGRPLQAFKEVRLELAELLSRLQAMRAMVWQAARYPVPFQAGGAMTKAFCADSAWEVCTRAMMLLGDHGYLHGQGVEKAARDARLTQIYEGTNQVNRLAVFEGQQGAELAAEAPEGLP